ncbi:hypothetical protein GCM10020220_030940 [Nonomuraea rubra]
MQRTCERFSASLAVLDRATGDRQVAERVLTQMAIDLGSLAQMREDSPDVAAGRIRRQACDQRPFRK